MAAFTLYDAYFPIMRKSLDSADSILTDAESHAKANNINADAEYAEARLYADMYTLTQQIQTLTRTISTTLSLLRGEEIQQLPEEKTFAELHARVQKTRELLREFKPEEVNGREDEILSFAPLQLSQPVKEWLPNVTLTNVFFHLVTAYGILRTNGVPLGKKVFLGPFAAP